MILCSCRFIITPPTTTYTGYSLSSSTTNTSKTSHIETTNLSNRLYNNINFPQIFDQHLIGLETPKPNVSAKQITEDYKAWCIVKLFTDSIITYKSLQQCLIPTLMVYIRLSSSATFTQYINTADTPHDAHELRAYNFSQHSHRFFKQKVTQLVWFCFFFQVNPQKR